MVAFGKVNLFTLDKKGRVESGSFSPSTQAAGEKRAPAYPSNNDDLMARLDRLDKRELKPSYDEANLDFYA